MSAIAGLVMLDGSGANVEAIKSMLASMQHGGPDAQRFVQCGNTAFGQALLATTPEALAEVQPWTDPNTGCIVVTDSRLDNREILAASLALCDRAIDTIGDAELIFTAYQAWGEACPEKLLGDFSFVIWNPNTGVLFCARDPLGIRPFYYHYIAESIFAFATTSSALRGLLKGPVALDEGRLTDALTDHLEGYDHTSTFFRDIKRLAPAHSLNFQLHAAPQLNCYWQPLKNPPSPFPASEKQWLEQLENLFVDAVHCRLRSHLPIGSMLSGGLDSSAVAAVACEKLKQNGKPNLSTFSAVSSDVNCAETRAIQLMQSSFAFHSTEIDSKKSPELLQAIAAQWPHFDEPFEACATLVHAQYIAAHKNKLRIMLDGIDADALLAEGNYLHELAKTGQWRRVWRESRAAVRFWGSEASLGYFLRPLLSEFLIPMPLRRLVRRLRSLFRPTGSNKQALITHAFAKKVDLESRYGTYRQNAGGCQQIEESGQAAYSLMAGSNSTVAIERYHRMASYHGIEPRHPFLDRRLVEFCAWLPLELRMRNGYPKWALRQAMSQRLPHEIAWRSGKEHLGWLFSKALWEHTESKLIGEGLHPWLKGAVLASVQTRFDELTTFSNTKPVNENEIEPLLSLSAMNIWLNGLDKSR
jgi:asparagine synthase (glutamine-hydrolysing)